LDEENERWAMGNWNFAALKFGAGGSFLEARIVNAFPWFWVSK